MAAERSTLEARAEKLLEADKQKYGVLAASDAWSDGNRRAILNLLGVVPKGDEAS